MDGFTKQASKNLDEENLDFDQIPDIFAQMFDRLDSDGNNYVRDEEIRAARYARSFSGTQALLLDIVGERSHDIEELSNDEWGDENNGVSLNDLRDLKKIIRRDGSLNQSQQDVIDNIKEMIPGIRDARDPKVFARLLMENFSKLDSDHNDVLTKPEIKNAIDGSTSSAELYKLAKGLNKHIEGLSSFMVDDITGGITWKDALSFRYHVDPDFGFNEALRNEQAASRYAIIEDGVVSTLMGLSTGLLGAVSVALPEIALITGPIAICAGTIAAQELREVYRSYKRPAEFKVEYETQRQRLENWEYFTEQKGS